jgi:hypothetical protein
VTATVAELRNAARVERDASKRVVPDGDAVFVVRLRGSEWTLLADYAMVPAVWDLEPTRKLTARLSREAGEAILFVRLAAERHQHGEPVEVVDWTAMLQESPAKGLRAYDAASQRLLREADAWFRERRILVPACRYAGDGYICRLEVSGLRRADIETLDIVILREE